MNAIDASIDIVASEDEFRDAFLALPDERHVDDPPSNLAYFLRCHEHIHFFARRLDEALELNESPSLKELFWSIALAAIKVCRQALDHHIESCTDY